MSQTKLKEYRERLRISQEEAANKLGVSSRTVCRWEQGLTAPAVNLVKSIKALYRLTQGELDEYLSELDALRAEEAS